MLWLTAAQHAAVRCSRLIVCCGLFLLIYLLIGQNRQIRLANDHLKLYSDWYISCTHRISQNKHLKLYSDWYISSTHRISQNKANTV